MLMIHMGWLMLLRLENWLKMHFWMMILCWLTKNKVKISLLLPICMILMIGSTSRLRIVRMLWKCWKIFRWGKKIFKLLLRWFHSFLLLKMAIKYPLMYPLPTIFPGILIEVKLSVLRDLIGLISMIRNQDQKGLFSLKIHQGLKLKRKLFRWEKEEISSIWKQGFLSQLLTIFSTNWSILDCRRRSRTLSWEIYTKRNNKKWLILLSNMQKKAMWTTRRNWRR